MGKQNQIDEHLIEPHTIEDEASHDDSNRAAYKFDSLTSASIWGYAIGHIFNDLCASSWFNFLLFYLTKVLNFEAGSYTMLFGQIADALGTPSAGILSDKYNTRFGKRTPWYILSFVMVQITFLPMWCYPIMSSILPMDNESFKTFFFIFFPAAFNYFWAFGYIAHISLVPSMTCSRVRRDILNTRRNTFTFFANMLLLLIALLAFQIIDSSEQQFQFIGITCSIIGAIFTGIFLLTVHEVPLTISCDAAVKDLKKVLKLRTESEVNISFDRKDINLTTSQISSNSSNEASSIVNAQKVQQPLKQKQKKEYVEVLEAEVLDENGKKIDNIEFPTNKQLRAEKPNKAATEEEESDELIVDEGLNNKQKLKISLLRSSKGDSLIENVVSWKQWFRERAFYQYAFVFMFARLFCNVTTTMLNFYLYYVIEIGGSADQDNNVKLTFQLALIPLLVYTSSVGASAILNQLYQAIGRKGTYTLGVFIMLVALIPLTFLEPGHGVLKNLIYPIALLLGAAQALQLNTAINLISEVIGLRGAGGAFVFGAYSFLDKLITGIVLFAITESQSYKDNDPTFIRWIIVIIPIASGIAAWILILFGKAKDYDPKNKAQKLSRMSLGDEFVS